MKYSAISTRYSSVTNSHDRQQQTSAVVNLLQLHKVYLICLSSNLLVKAIKLSGGVCLA